MSCVGLWQGKAALYREPDPVWACAVVEVGYAAGWVGGCYRVDPDGLSRHADGLYT